MSNLGKQVSDIVVENNKLRGQLTNKEREYRMLKLELLKAYQAIEEYKCEEMSDKTEELTDDLAHMNRQCQETRKTSEHCGRRMEEYRKALNHANERLSRANGDNRTLLERCDTLRSENGLLVAEASKWSLRNVLSLLLDKLAAAMETAVWFVLAVACIAGMVGVLTIFVEW